MDEKPQRTVAFLGLGEMGAAMASRLLDEGLGVTVWNRSPEPVARLAQQGGVSVAQTVESAFASQSVVHSMLTDDAVVLRVFDDRLLSRVPPGRTHVQHATISPAAAAELAECHQQHGVHYVSAPVLGRSAVIARGDLLVVASGDATAIDTALPSLSALGRRVWNVGTDPRLALIVKLGVNYSIIHALQSMAESVSLIESAGIDAARFIEILTHTAFSGSAHRGYGTMIADRNYQPVGFSMSLGLKDLCLVERTAQDLGVSLPMAPTLHDLFSAAIADDQLAELDWSAVAEITRARRTR